MVWLFIFTVTIVHGDATHCHIEAAHQVSLLSIAYNFAADPFLYTCDIYIIASDSVWYNVTLARGCYRFSDRSPNSYKMLSNIRQCTSYSLHLMNQWVTLAPWHSTLPFLRARFLDSLRYLVRLLNEWTLRC